VSVLADLERLALAVALLRRRARISIVHHETGVSRAKLRALYREIHGHGAPSGQIPMIGGATIQTRAQQIHAGLFAALYERYGGPATTRQLDIRAVVAAHDLYRAMAPNEAPMDLNAAWVIARDLRVGTAELRTCSACAVRYLVASASRLSPTCPFCSLHARRVRKPVPAATHPLPSLEFGGGPLSPSRDAPKPGTSPLLVETGDTS
jgi:hypothetical protein